MAASSAHSAATVASAKTLHSVVTNRTEKKPDLLERFREPKVCDIPATSKPKPDAFDELRPKPRTVLGYNISQTDTKIQRKVTTGITKLHIQQTSAEYELPPPGYVFPQEPLPPPPPPEPIFQYSTGRGPCWEFLDDIWRRKVEQRQEAHRRRLQQLIRETRKYDEERKFGEHIKMMKLVGPDWFQELSPKQLRTVDSLKNCIVQDVKSKSTCNTQINIAELGLVLRPNPIHIKMALKKCCECPVEFLLLLYQLMNRRRTEYSLNDRLLLSAVVHLTMRETLKELHIRIPSPPPSPKKPKTPPKKEKKKHYKSPYLVPFTFKPEPRKHTGIYKNSHIQYPESPYFSYIPELKAELIEKIVSDPKEEDDDEEEELEADAPEIIITMKQSGITNAQEKELVDELRTAQRKYNTLTSYQPMPYLRKPSIYIPCDHGLKNRSKEEDEGEEDASSDSETNATVSVEVRVTTDFDESCRPIRKICECKITFDEWKTPKHLSIEKAEGAESISESEVGEEGEEEEETESEQKKSWENKYTSTRKTDTIATNDVALSTYGLGKQSPSSIDKSTNEENESNVEKSVASENDKAEVEIVEHLVTLGQRESSECKCKEEVEKVIETNLCQCDRCKADRAEEIERKKPTYIISGLQDVQIKLLQEEDEEGEEEGEEVIELQTVPVIAGVKAKKTCDCLQKFQARVKMYEEMKKRFDALHNLLTLQQQYVIGGVTRSPEGDPVYMLSGVVPQRECSCVQIYQEQLKEARRLANMPKIPMGRQKYVISGVHETEHGNVYIMSGAVATEDCTCMKMYKSYEKKHMPCLQAYEDYLKKIALDVEEYMNELYSENRYGDLQPPESVTEEETKNSSTVSTEFYEEQESRSSGTENLDSVNRKSNLEEKIIQRQTEKVCKCGVIDEEGEEGEEEEAEEEEEECVQTKEICQCGVIDEDDLIIETDLNLTLEVNKDGKSKKKSGDECTCGPEPDYTVCICQQIERTECECGNDSDSEESIEPDVDLRRFIILEKIPCKLSEQLDILKQALEVLAEDGFPLAKLPESYKLPHFKLWMQLRCGKFWTQEDRVPMLMKSFGYWRHTNYCTARKVRVPELGMSKAEARKYTWANAKFIKQMTAEKDTMYYRQLRQANIGDGREFFPTTFSYELPTPNFRDCFFAYVPAKEEECICWRPWYPHEIRNTNAKKSC